MYKFSTLTERRDRWVPTAKMLERYDDAAKSVEETAAFVFHGPDRWRIQKPE